MTAEPTPPSAKPGSDRTLQRKISTSRLLMASSTSSSSRILRSSSKEPRDTQMSKNNNNQPPHSLKRSLNENDSSQSAASAKRPSLWTRGQRLEDMTTPAPARHTAIPPSTLQSSRTRQSQPEQVLLAHDKARELSKKLEVAHEEISRLEHKDSQTSDRELGLERKVLDLQRELRETNLRLEDREARVSKLEQDRIIVSGQIDAQEEERQKAIQTAEEKVKKYKAAASAAKEELGKLKERNTSLEQHVRLATHNEARANQLSSDSAIRIRFLEEDKSRLQAENHQLSSNIVQYQSEIEKLHQQKNQQAASGSGDSSAHRDVIRKELIRHVDRYKDMEQANARMTRELATLRSRHSNVELLKEENHQLKQRLRHFDQARQQLASTEVKLAKLVQERAEWAVFIKENQNEFKSPREFFKSLGGKRIENASLRARLGSMVSEIKSRDRMIGELETRLEEADQERNIEFAEKIKAQGQAQIAERNRELDRRRVQILNEQLKSYTNEEKSLYDGVNYDQQKDLRITQLQELLDSHQDELARVQREAAELRQQLHTQSTRSPSVSANSESRSTEKGQALTTSLSEQIDRNEELEQELDELTDAKEMLKMEVDSLQLQVHRLERDLGRGEFNPSTTQVLCPEGSPVEVEQAIRSSMLEGLKAENAGLLKQISKLEKGLKPSEEQESTGSLVPRESLVSSQQEIERLQAEVARQIKARERLCEMYRETTATYKRAIWDILGYSLEAVANGEFRLRSALKDEGSSTMLFVPGKADGGHFEFKPNPNSSFHQSSLVVNLYDHWVHHHHSIPGFTAALTLDLFNSKSAAAASSSSS
ncbi:coiled-coil domain-containing protein mad1 [Puccinia graminis f. sp. tritici]|uniref:Spindle assembly checkpoint component MAD1 n=1 Tax=Puccinia graminis f. sp. tritici TaxID=56615 RepID=A0A5B0LR29_PUCGR|nr:coiled-coil domain-containing protein mad1 [Puccinia graminis f. sp. tritici]KAA1130348.1 coiled-coil domain-containing protein mad1 [Puccinia graminis f. sp. tritici]